MTERDVSDSTLRATERRALLLSAGANGVIGVVGLAAAALASSQAILLDGVFNLTYLAMGLFTIRVVRLVERGDDERFPAGYAAFEPLVIGIKGVLVLGISVMAFLGALAAVLDGGRLIAPGLATGYATFATVACGVAAIVARRGARATGSPSLAADAANWTINTAISACVLVAFGALFLMRGTALEPLSPYVDPAVVLVLVAITIGVPIRMAWGALMELLHRAPAPEIVEGVERAVRAVFDAADAPDVRDVVVRVVQPGRTRVVLVHALVEPKSRIDAIEVLDARRAELARALCEQHPNTIVDVVFTADPTWAAGVAVGGEAGSGS